MNLSVSSRKKSRLIAQLIGLNLVEGPAESCLVYQQGDFVTKTLFCGKDSDGPFVDLYDSNNLHLAWRAAAFGLLHYPQFKAWWELHGHDDTSSRRPIQHTWLDKLLQIAFKQMADLLAVIPGPVS